MSISLVLYNRVLNELIPIQERPKHLLDTEFLLIFLQDIVDD